MKVLAVLSKDLLSGAICNKQTHIEIVFIQLSPITIFFIYKSKEMVSFRCLFSYLCFSLLEARFSRRKFNVIKIQINFDLGCD